ncbi:hypothetical protein Ancab_013687 [Ancistrocladus abbreviatus]
MKISPMFFTIARVPGIYGGGLFHGTFMDSSGVFRRRNGLTSGCVGYLGDSACSLLSFSLVLVEQNQCLSRALSCREILWLWTTLMQQALQIQRGREMFNIVRGLLTRREQLINRSPPPPGRVKLNFNGSMHGRLRDGAGGLLRDEDGRWLRGYARRLGRCSTTSTECWSLLIGLKTA